MQQIYMEILSFTYIIRHEIFTTNLSLTVTIQPLNRFLGIKTIKMNANKKKGRIIGVLFLLNFITGIFVYQVLQGPILFGDSFLTDAASAENQLIISTLLGIFMGVNSIIIAIILLPLFKKHNFTLAFLYLAFCILYFIVVCIDNTSVLSMLELSKEYVKTGSSNDANYELMETMFFKRHWWTHYFSLLISSLPVFVLYYTFFTSKLIPRILSGFGIFAATLLFVEIALSLFGHGLGMNMLLPIGLVQLILPIWLLIKGLNSLTEKPAAA